MVKLRENRANPLPGSPVDECVNDLEDLVIVADQHVDVAILVVEPRVADEVGGGLWEGDRAPLKYAEIMLLSMKLSSLSDHR